jgi:hypothetical protein
MFVVIRQIPCFIAQLITDESDRPSLAKGNLLIGASIGAFAIAKMAILGTLTEGMLAIFLTFCSGHLLVSKSLDLKAGKA